MKDIAWFFVEYWFLFVIWLICGLIWLIWRMFEHGNWKEGWHSLVHEKDNFFGRWTPLAGVLLGLITFIWMLSQIWSDSHQKAVR